MRVYFDQNATTSPHPRVRAAMAEALVGDVWGNPSSLHAEGRAARAAVECARREVAALLGADPTEIVFTSGGTEANELALRLGLGQTGGRVVSSPLEHPSVRGPLWRLSLAQRPGPSEGHAGRVQVVWLPVDDAGRLSPADLRQQLGDTTDGPVRLVSLALANHEIGNLYPIAELTRICHEHGALVHCDAVQAVGRVPVDVRALDVDFLSLSGHKLHGPKGVGALYCRAGSRDGGRADGRAGAEGRSAAAGQGLSGGAPTGGGQERGRRPGTENVLGIIGLGVACAAAREELPGRAARTAALRDRLEARLLHVPGARRNGDGRPGARVPGTSNLAFAGVEGEVVMMDLDLHGVAVSTGAACSSGSPDPSPVLLALGQPSEAAREAVRFSLGADNTEAEVDQVAAWVAACVARVRALGAG